MRNKMKLGGLALLLAVALTGCEYLKTAEQEAAPIVSTDDYPVATYTTDFSGNSVTEGDTIMYTITTDKMLDRSITFHATWLDGTADDHDYTYSEAVLAPYSTEVSMMVVFPQEDIIEPDETVQLEIGPISLADKYLLNPTTQNPILDLTIANVNQAGKVTVNMDWNNEDDNDFVILSDTPTYPETAWSYGGATGAQPETDVSIWDTDPDGNYYVSILDWGNPDFDYVFTIGLPDGSTETFEGSFSSSTAAEDYTYDLFDGAYDSYRIIRVAKSGTSYTFTQL